MQSSLHDRIRERAYELWNAAGRVDGHAEQQWRAAERELLGEMVAQIPAPGKSTSSPRAGSKRAAQGYGAGRLASADQAQQPLKFHAPCFTSRHICLCKTRVI
jgi:hypothetical protein